MEDDHPAEEIKRLQRCISNLVGLVALPASWAGAEPTLIARTLLDAVEGILDLDLVFVRLIHPSTGSSIEMARVVPGRELPSRAHAVRTMLELWLGGDPRQWPPVLRQRFGERELSVVPIPIGLQGDHGALIAGSERPDFPSQTERLLLTVAKNQAVIALQEARLLSEQKRLAETLDRRVAQRTAELAVANEGLRRSKAFLSEAQRLSLTGSFSWRVATDEITWSDQVYRIFELDRAVPMTLERLETRIHPDDLALFWNVVNRARRERADFEYDQRLLMPDGTAKHLHVVAHAVRDPASGVEFIGAVQDVTERRRSQEALDKARSELTRVARATALGTLTASIAHEVSQPLAGIVTNASTCLRMLAAEPPNLNGARETLRRTLRDGHRASEVVTRLRGLFTRKALVGEPVDLNEATREVVAVTTGELRRSKVAVHEELAGDLPRVSGDRVQLQQVILNLLLNAADAMSGVDGRPRQLVVRTRRDGDGVCLSVQDTGVGFAPEDAERLFEAFYTTKTQGMGIGLSVSRSIIERHHGRLWAAPNDGPGATFAFTIPTGASTKV